MDFNKRSLKLLYNLVSAYYNTENVLIKVKMSKGDSYSKDVILKY